MTRLAHLCLLVTSVTPRPRVPLPSLTHRSTRRATSTRSRRAISPIPRSSGLATLFYLYATTDGNGGGRGPATVWVSRDFVNWVLVPMNWPTTPHYWAPTLSSDPMVATTCSTTSRAIPTAAFRTAGRSVDSAHARRWFGDPDRLIQNVITLHTQVFEDRGDGTLYGYRARGVSRTAVAASACSIPTRNPSPVSR